MVAKNAGLSCCSDQSGILKQCNPDYSCARSFHLSWITGLFLFGLSKTPRKHVAKKKIVFILIAQIKRRTMLGKHARSEEKPPDQERDRALLSQVSCRIRDQFLQVSKAQMVCGSLQHSQPSLQSGNILTCQGECRHWSKVSRLSKHDG